MSHSTAAIKFIDGTILHGEYNGTVDVMQPKLYSTGGERDVNWRIYDWPLHDKNCDRSEDVIIAVSYGGGFSWSGKACRSCMLLTDNWSPYDDNEERSLILSNELPDWYPNRELY